MDEAPERPRTLLVYNRIDANRRQTRLLLIGFALALLPVVVCGGAFMVPWKTMYVAAMQAYVEWLQAYQANQAGWVVERWARLRESPTVLSVDVSTFLLFMALVLLSLAGAAAFLISRYGSRVVLRLAHARPVSLSDERELVQVVENLCVGAGLPVPRVHVIESTSPNAFATGRNPHDASLVVTRGLLRLLDRRELEGVVAHELSHIGNQDIALSTTLAALVGALSVPWKLVSALFCSPHVAIAVFLFCLVTVLPLSPSCCGTCPIEEQLAFTQRAFWQGIPTYVIWLAGYGLIVPVYAVFIAPAAALRIRQAVSRQREFLAEADAALLTRDPEGLALALVKIGAAGGEPLQVGESTVHLYFVDPSSRGSWIHGMFPSHPPLEERVELLARMCSGIAPSAIQAAKDAGARFQLAKSDRDELHAPVPGPSDEDSRSRTQTTATTELTSTDATSNMRTGFDGVTRIYELPAEGSRLLALLPAEAVLELKGRVGDFVAVTTEDGMAGYVFRPEPLG